MTDQNVTKSKVTVKSPTKSITGSVSSFGSRLFERKVAPADIDSKNSQILFGIHDDNNLRKSNTSINTSNSFIEIESSKSNLCCQKFLSKLRKLWATRNTENFEDNIDLFLKTTLRELLVYIVFLILLLIINFGMLSSNIYYLTSAVNGMYNNQNFSTVSDIPSFWQYLQQTVIPATYGKSKTDANTNVTTYGPVIPEIVQLGIPQLRMLKVLPNTCQVPSPFTNAIFQCYAAYSESISDRSIIPNISGTAGNFTSAANTDFSRYSGTFGTYEGGGYIQLLSNDQNVALNILNNLQNSLWVTTATRVVFLDMNFYNPNINLFTIVKIVFEFPNSGGAFATSIIRTVKLIRYLTPFDYFVLCCEVMFLLFLVYYTVEEIIEVKQNRLAYFKDLWNILDLVVIGISFVCAVFNVYRVVSINSKLNLLIQNQNTYIDFDFISYWQKIFNQSISATVYFAWIKIFKYINFNKRMSQLTDTIGRAMKLLTGFCVMFAIVFIAFSMCGYLIFSSAVNDFNCLSNSIFSLFRIILADFNFAALQQAHALLGPLYFLSYIFIVFLNLFNMFVAIIYDSYVQVRNDIDGEKNVVDVSQFIKQKIFRTIKQNKIIKMQDVLENSNLAAKEQVTYQELRAELQKCGYAEVEIQSLFHQYDKDHDQMLDYDERQEMLRDLKANKFAYASEKPGESETKNIESDVEDEEMLAKAVTEEDVEELKDRINLVENGIADIVDKLDMVLFKLAQIEQAKLDYQKNVRYSIDILSGSQTSLRVY